MPQIRDLGMILYDIPDTLRSFRNYLRRRLRQGRALPVNLSVYLINWGDLPTVKAILDSAKRDYEDEGKLPNGYPLNCHIMKYDDVTAEEGHRLALEGLSRLCAEIHSSIAAKLKKMRKTGEKEMPRRVQVTYVKRITEIENLAMAFRLSDDLDIAIEASRKAVVAQIGPEVAEKYMKDAATKPETKTGTKGTKSKKVAS
jgi:hypothetical protein